MFGLTLTMKGRSTKWSGKTNDLRTEKKGRDMKQVTDVSRGARETKVDLSQFSIYARGPDIYSGEKPTGQTRGFWLFWLRPEGGTYKPGFNLTICRGFAISLVVLGKRYRFRFRPLIKPRFLWEVE